LAPALGGFHTGEHGDASWSYDVELPEALFSPSLRLTYNSANGPHGWLGRGWDLSGWLTVRAPMGREARATSSLGEVYRVSGPVSGLIAPEGEEWNFVSEVPGSGSAVRDGDDWVFRSGGVTTRLATSDGVRWFPQERCRAQCGLCLVFAVSRRRRFSGASCGARGRAAFGNKEEARPVPELSMSPMRGLAAQHRLLFIEVSMLLTPLRAGSEQNLLSKTQSVAQRGSRDNVSIDDDSQCSGRQPDVWIYPVELAADRFVARHVRSLLVEPSGPPKQVVISEWGGRHLAPCWQSSLLPTRERNRIVPREEESHRRLE
jgi:hypothetical protein